MSANPSVMTLYILNEFTISRLFHDEVLGAANQVYRTESERIRPDESKHDKLIQHLWIWWSGWFRQNLSTYNKMAVSNRKLFVWSHDDIYIFPDQVFLWSRHHLCNSLHTCYCSGYPWESQNSVFASEKRLSRYDWCIKLKRFEFRIPETRAMLNDWPTRHRHKPL